MNVSRRRTSGHSTTIALVTLLLALSFGCCCLVPCLSGLATSPEGGPERTSYPFFDRPNSKPAPLECDAPSQLRRPDTSMKGSSGALHGHTLTLAVFVSTGRGEGWSAQRKEWVKASVTTAHRFLESEAKRYGHELKMSAAFYGEDTPVVVPRVATYLEDDMGGVTDAIEALSSGQSPRRWLKETMRRHGADSVHLVAFVDEEGRAYALPASSDRPRIPIESTVVYAFDEGPLFGGIIAHEILHLYGAKDLYSERATQSLVSTLIGPLAGLVSEKWPHEIMVTSSRSEDIPRYVGPYTAWLIGWSECTESDFITYINGDEEW